MKRGNWAPLGVIQIEADSLAEASEKLANHLTNTLRHPDVRIEDGKRGNPCKVWSAKDGITYAVIPVNTRMI